MTSLLTKCSGMYTVVVCDAPATHKHIDKEFCERCWLKIRERERFDKEGWPT